MRSWVFLYAVKKKKALGGENISVVSLQRCAVCIPCYSCCILMRFIGTRCWGLEEGLCDSLNSLLPLGTQESFPIGASYRRQKATHKSEAYLYLQEQYAVSWCRLCCVSLCDAVGAERHPGVRTVSASVLLLLLVLSCLEVGLWSMYLRADMWKRFQQKWWALLFIYLLFI